MTEDPRFWWFDATGDDSQPQAFEATYAIVDEDAGGVIAYVGSSERADQFVNLLSA